MTRVQVLQIVRDARECGRWVNLHEADLRWADLRWADLHGADLHGANLRGANLRGANLHGANLYGADLHGADLRGADLHGANLYGARWDGLSLQGLPSGDMLLTPTCDGWVLHVGCEAGTVQHLRDIIAGDEWPSGSGEPERERRRPILAAVADLADAWIAAHPNVVPTLAERWGQS